MTRRIAIKFVLTGVLLAGTWFSNPVLARGLDADPVAAVSIAELPRQAVETYRLIRLGGPFPHDKDGIVFGNRERLLPSQKRGYYREYTVPTPGARDRGKRRIVCGGPTRMPDACYYTADHYSSFRRIEP